MQLAKGAPFSYKKYHAFAVVEFVSHPYEYGSHLMINRKSHTYIVLVLDANTV